MKCSTDLFKRFTTYFLSAGIVLFTAVGCGSSSEEQAASEEATEQAEPELMQEPEPEPEADQSDIEDVETQEVVNPAPPIERQSPEFAELEALKEANRNNEVLAGINVRYGDWDTDSDNVLNENEFYNGFFAVWDRDDSNSINEEEFRTATENLFLNYDFDQYGEFSDWDADGNGALSNQEFLDGMNNILTSSEGKQAANRLFTVWDLDNDEKIERIELENAVILLDADDN